MKDAFGLRDSFEPKVLFTLSEGCKTIQMVTPDVGKLFLNNEKAIRKRRVVHAGMKVILCPLDANLSSPLMIYVCVCACVCVLCFSCRFLIRATSAIRRSSDSAKKECTCYYRI
jgi:hypothetical protein